MTSFEGDTGPYLQYAHTRLLSIRRKSTLSEPELSALETADWSLLREAHAIELVRTLAQWPPERVDGGVGRGLACRVCLAEMGLASKQASHTCIASLDPAICVLAR